MTQEPQREQLFCDRLSLWSFVALWMSAPVRGAVIKVLDPLPRVRLMRAIVAYAFRFRGVTVAESSFFAGHLLTPEGECVRLKARRLTAEFSLRAARELVDRVKLLTRLNQQFGRNTITLHVARMLWQAVEQKMLRILIAESLAGGTPATIVLARPLQFNGDVLSDVSRSVSARWYRWRGLLFAKARFILPSIVRLVMDAVRRFFSKHSKGFEAAENDGCPSLLLVQEDDLSMDRSHRGQPHWVFPDSPRPSYPTYVVQLGHVKYQSPDLERLQEHGIHVLTRTQQVMLSKRSLSHEEKAFWSGAARACLIAALRSASSAETAAASAVWRLLGAAQELAALCRRLNVGMFLTGESQLIEADAMQLVSEYCGIATVAYQYSNLPTPSPAMLTTANLMLTFSPLFRTSWQSDGVAPGSFLDIGYTYDSCFPLLRARAQSARAKLESAGARFVICYFDETVHHDRYGLISREDHLAELHTLAGLLLRDASVGLVTKSQFERNSPSRLYPEDEILRRAKATGRYLELCHGTHRNVIFPAEAAMVSDIAIGQVIGATAALEAATAGARCVMLNRYSMLVNAIYGEGQIVFSTIQELLEAIAAFRSGNPGYRQLGDWTPILQFFDPYRDGASAGRMSRVIEQHLTTSRSSGTVAQQMEIKDYGSPSRPRVGGQRA